MAAASSNAVAAVVYVSSAAPGLVSQLRALAASVGTPSARVLNVFSDVPYARTSLLIAGEPTAVARTAVSTARAAVAELDLREHVATHPRIGTVDHIAVAPLPAAPTAAAVAAAAAPALDFERARGTALSIGTQLGAGDEPLSVYLYGAAHAHGRSLAATRRLTPYFKPTAGWAAPPELGPRTPSERAGACCVGAVRLVLNYNLLLDTTEQQLARAVADAVRGRTGGLPAVEALALRHGDERYEVACNLLEPDDARSSPAAVRARAEEAARALGVSVVSDYTIGLTADQIVARLAEPAEPHA